MTSNQAGCFHSFCNISDAWGTAVALSWWRWWKLLREVTHLDWKIWVDPTINNEAWEHTSVKFAGFARYIRWKSHTNFNRMLSHPFFLESFMFEEWYKVGGCLYRLRLDLAPMHAAWLFRWVQPDPGIGRRPWWILGPQDDPPGKWSLCIIRWDGGFHKWGTPLAGWFIVEDPIKMDDNWGYPISGNHHIVWLSYYVLLTREESCRAEKFKKNNSHH